jgi:hypothetical protein
MTSIGGEKRQRRPRSIASGPEQRDSDGGIGSDQPLSVERDVRGNETSNIEERISSGYCAIDRSEESVKGMAKWIKEAGRGQ